MSENIILVAFLMYITGFSIGTGLHIGSIGNNTIIKQCLNNNELKVNEVIFECKLKEK
jgi:hypothetical protein